jgi:hypothetical protein
MQKGQLSLDLLTALIVAIIAVLAINTIIPTYAASNERSTIQQQLQYSANKTAAQITAAQALADTTFTIELHTGKIYYTDENNLYKNAYPVITNYPDKNMINYSITFQNQKQDANSFYYAPPNTTITPNNSSKPGTVVIKNGS